MHLLLDKIKNSNNSGILRCGNTTYEISNNVIFLNELEKDDISIKERNIFKLKFKENNDSLIVELSMLNKIMKFTGLAKRPEFFYLTAYSFAIIFDNNSNILSVNKTKYSSPNGESVNEFENLFLAEHLSLIFNKFNEKSLEENIEMFNLAFDCKIKDIPLLDNLINKINDTMNSLELKKTNEITRNI